MGDHDAPSQIDFVRQQTGNDKVTYIGHSQGTSQMFYALSDKPDFWQERVNLFIALAPVTNLANCSSDLLVLIAKTIPVLKYAINVLGKW